ncbi:MAG: hypothetical protein JW719_07400 [Pirellulales bacterium]|nr:hypothetical protein [Pirellulales bacterium]
MSPAANQTFRRLLLVLLILSCLAPGQAEEPPALNPFGPRPADRDDARPGRIELSDGSIHRGMIYLTRDVRLKIHDDRLHRQREIPLRAAERIDCEVKREWMEKEWRFKETTADEKLLTGREYPVREYLHTITLRDGRKIKGPMSAIVYLRPTTPDPTTPGENRKPGEPRRFVLHKRDKGPPGANPKSLVYVRSIRLEKDSAEKPSDTAPNTNTRSRTKTHNQPPPEVNPQE